MDQDKTQRVDQVVAASRTKITAILTVQVICMLLIMVALVALNTGVVAVFSGQIRTVVNSALLGYLGTLVFFSRKCYVYLITNKFLRMIEENQKNWSDSLPAILSTVRGYYLYLLFRPLVGLVIGPVLYMFFLCGLITFMNAPATSSTDLSRSGTYLIYVISFVGGHASSDLLDRFSRLAKKMVIEGEKTNEDLS